MNTRQITVSFGGYECCADSPAYAVTTTNALGSTTYEVCNNHRDECTRNASTYVPGWGRVQTTTTERIEQ